MDAPQFPVGPNDAEERNDPSHRASLIEVIEKAPGILREAVGNLSLTQLDTRYKNWTIRQIVHHLADNDVNVYVRFMWALTEDNPAIKGYDNPKWAQLEVSHRGPVEAPLRMMAGVHDQWVQLLRSMTEEQFGRSFYHPVYNRTMTLSYALASYAWHCRHHTGQILWLREQKHFGL